MCMHMPHGVLGRPRFGSGGPTTLPGEALWVPQWAQMAGARVLGRQCPRDGALGCMRHGREGSGGGGPRHPEPGYQVPNIGSH